MVGDSPPSLEISLHPTDLRVTWGMATLTLQDILHCHNDQKVSGFSSHVSNI